MTRAVVLLARAPWVPGKTRLTTGLTPDAGDRLRLALLLDTFDVIASIENADILVAFTPDDARTEIEALVNGNNTSYTPQRGSDLGARMYNALLDAFTRGAHHVVLVGSDVPTLPASHISAALKLLESGRDLVLGPSEDGGYYLVGMTRDVRTTDVFSGIEWGTSDVLTTTLETADDVGLDTALVEPWYDVDTPVDLARITRDPRPDAARHTREWIRAFRNHP